jgi:hypothetical protein
MFDQDNDVVRPERMVWDLLCTVQKSMGLDMPEFLGLLVRKSRASLSQWAAEADFDDLCRKGCNEVSLALAFWSFEIAQRTERLWRRVIPTARRRQQVARKLENAADVLEELHSSWNLAVLAELKKSLPGNPPESATSDQEILSMISRMEPGWLPNSPAPFPVAMIRSLRLYAGIVNFFSTISKETQAHSSDSIPRYLISAYVKRSTGDFNDARVSALICRSLGVEAYDETAHRVWRSRNYERLEKEYAFLVHILANIGMVSSSNT